MAIVRRHGRPSGAARTPAAPSAVREPAVAFRRVTAGRDSGDRADERSRRRAARETIGAYHEQQLRLLLELVRDGFARLDAGEIDPFELDDLIHHYKRSARELWKFCGSSGSDWERAVRTLAFLRDNGDEPDWWQASASRARH
jgi:hypothetical protein